MAQSVSPTTTTKDTITTKGILVVVFVAKVNAPNVKNNQTTKLLRKIIYIILDMQFQPNKTK